MWYFITHVAFVSLSNTRGHIFSWRLHFKAQSDISAVAHTTYRGFSSLPDKETMLTRSQTISSLHKKQLFTSEPLTKCNQSIWSPHLACKSYAQHKAFVFVPNVVAEIGYFPSAEQSGVLACVLWWREGCAGVDVSLKLFGSNLLLEYEGQFCAQSIVQATSFQPPSVCISASVRVFAQKTEAQRSAFPSGKSTHSHLSLLEKQLRHSTKGRFYLDYFALFIDFI